MLTFDKIGSCVTSDIFNFLDINHYYIKNGNTAINIENIINEASLNIPPNYIIADNNYGKKMVEKALNHNPLFLPLVNNHLPSKAVSFFTGID